METALVLPLFLAAVLTLASFLPMIKNQEEIESSVLEAGKWASEADYFYEKWGQRSELAEGVILQEKIRAGLSVDGFHENSLVGGRLGFYGLECRTGKEISLKIYHLPKLAVSLVRFPVSTAKEQAVTRGFVGDASFPGVNGAALGEDAGSEEDYVYVTDYGVVYHRSLSCPHLNLHIRAGTLAVIEGERNDSGGKYYPCEYCHPSPEVRDVPYYYTTDGDRYHAEYHCLALKRTIRQVPLSQVNLPPCSSCGW